MGLFGGTAQLNYDRQDGAPITPSYVVVGADGTLTNERVLTGTSNQVTITDNTTTVVVSLPQDIHSGASPSFAGLTLSVTPLAVTSGGTGATSASAARTALGLAIGTDVQAFDTGLAALAAFNTNGLLVQTANNTFAGRTLTGTSNQITVTNGDGVSGNPTLSTPQNIHTAATPQFAAIGVGGSADPNGIKTSAGNRYKGAASGAYVDLNTSDHVTIAPGTAGLFDFGEYAHVNATGGTKSQSALVVAGRPDVTTGYVDHGMWLSAWDGSAQRLTYQIGGEARWNGSAFTEYRQYLWDFVNSQTIYFIDNTNPDVFVFSEPGPPSVGVIDEKGKSVYIGGRQMGTLADFTTCALHVGPGDYDKNDTNTRTFQHVLIRPLLNFGASNTNTTVNILDVDTTNTGTTGATVNLARFRYGGSDRLVLSSGGALALTGSQTISSALTVAGSVTVDGGGLTLSDADDIVVGTSSGTKIGTSTSQKLGFFNATPIVQNTSTTDLRTGLINLGFFASGGASPLDLNGGALTAGSATVTGNLVVDTTTLTVDATNNRVGIGTSSPAFALHIDGVSAAAVASVDSYAGASIVRQRRGNGTNSAITRVASGDVLGNLQMWGAQKADTSAGATYQTASTVIQGIAQEDFTGTGNLGASLAFRTIATGSGTIATRALVNEYGLTLNTATVARGTTNPTNALTLINGTAPAGTLTNGVQLYSDTGKLKSADAAGTIGHVLSVSSVNTVTPTAQNRTLTVDIGGTTYYITAKTTND